MIAYTVRMLTPDGFPGQRLCVLPRPLVSHALTRDPTTRMLVTDAGHFPNAASHGRWRRRGAREAVVILCTEGRGWCEVDEQTIAVHAGNALVIPPAVPHLYRADTDDPWTIWWLHATGEDVPVLLPSITTERARTVEVSDVFRAVSTIRHVVECMERDETMPNLIAAAGSAWSLLAQLAADKAAGSRGRTDPIRAAQEYLRQNFAATTSVPELAHIAGLSTSHFCALFRAATGGGVTEYVKRLRMARARELLGTTSRSITDIAHLVGYPDAFYFSRQFRAVNGCSPSEYRNQVHGERV